MSGVYSVHQYKDPMCEACMALEIKMSSEQLEAERKSAWEVAKKSYASDLDQEVFVDGYLMGWKAARSQPTLITTKKAAAQIDNYQERLKATLSQPATKRCEYCDGTGDVHSIDGEWRGVCTECHPASARVVSDGDVDTACAAFAMKRGRTWPQSYSAEDRDGLRDAIRAALESLAPAELLMHKESWNKSDQLVAIAQCSPEFVNGYLVAADRDEYNWWIFHPGGNNYHGPFDEGRAEAIKVAMSLPSALAPAQQDPNGKLVGWWNGITPDVTDRSPFEPSVRWGANAENSSHDIPLYDGYNPIHYQQPAQSSVPMEALREFIEARRTLAPESTVRLLDTLEKLIAEHGGKGNG